MNATQAVHQEDVAQLKTVTELLFGRFDADEVAELVGLAYAIGRNRGGLEGAIKVANQIGVS